MPPIEPSLRRPRIRRTVIDVRPGGRWQAGRQAPITHSRVGPMIYITYYIVHRKHNIRFYAFKGSLCFVRHRHNNVTVTCNGSEDWFWSHSTARNECHLNFSRQINRNKRKSIGHNQTSYNRFTAPRRCFGKIISDRCSVDCVARRLVRCLLGVLFYRNVWHILKNDKITKRESRRNKRLYINDMDGTKKKRKIYEPYSYRIASRRSVAGGSALVGEPYKIAKFDF